MAVLERRQIGESATNFSIESDRILTPRQREVLRYIATGLSNKQIGNELGISDETVKNHIGNRLGYGSSEDGILQRLGAVDRLNAVLNGLDSGELTVEELTEGYDFARFDTMTPREIEALTELVRDNGRHSSVGEIAARLKIRINTVNNHFTSIFKKLDLYSAGSKTRAAVLFLAWQRQNAGNDAERL